MKEISSEALGSKLTDISGPLDACKMMWNQTWPLFFRPHITKILMLCYIMFSLFFVSEAFYLWYIRFLNPRDI